MDMLLRELSQYGPVGVGIALILWMYIRSNPNVKAVEQGFSAEQKLYLEHQLYQRLTEHIDKRFDELK